jgi:hypothetical protein
VVLAINSLPDEDDMVPRLFKRMKVSFTQLKVPSDGWLRQKYGTWIYPANVPLDGAVRVIYREFTLRGPSDLELLKNRVEELLAHTPKAPGHS